VCLPDAIDLLEQALSTMEIVHTVSVTVEAERENRPELRLILLIRKYSNLISLKRRVPPELPWSQPSFAAHHLLSAYVKRRDVSAYNSCHELRRSENLAGGRGMHHRALNDESACTGRSKVVIF
jgi:hypothetical protein